ncbi:MAG: CHC2 zinc finger domain-containing protein [Blastocatellia bacterium]
MIEQAEIDQVKRETDLVKLIESSGVKLKRKGKQLAGLCPFHDDREPSLIVDPKKQLWNCLGACSEGGDVYKWVMKRDRVDFKAAHRLLAALALLAPSEAAKEDDEAKAEDGATAQQCLLWLGRVVEHYHRRLLETPAAQDYLRSRGITAPEFATTFRIGYADGTLLQVISPEGRQALKRIGVITESGRELMGGCVIFPLLDGASGEAVNLYGRYSGIHESLYLPGARHLYLPGVRRGVFNPQGARNTDEVIVTESVIDAAAIWSAGLRNVMPVYGVNGLTDEIVGHLQKCRVKRVTLALDSDDAGQYAAQKFGERLKEINVTARTVVLPAKDCSVWIASGATADDLRSLVAPARETPVIEISPAVEFEKLPEGALRAVINAREYRVRGLQPVGLDRLKVNLRLSVGGAFHLDTIDLYQARARSNFAQTAAKLCRVEESQIAADLLSLIESLERMRLDMKKTSAGAEAAPMTASEKEAALAFLQSPNLCERVIEDFKRCGFEGERETVLTAYLAAVSRKLPEPLSSLVIARSGAGKSALQDAVCGLVPPEDLVRVTRLTGQALFYKDSDSLKQKLLSIAEEEGAQAAVYSLRTLASDQHLAIAATRTDPQTGKLHTEHYEVHGPVSIIITTTSPEAFDEETRSRFVPLTLDESEAQTKAILERQRRRYSLEGTLERREAEAVRRLHHNAQRLLRPMEVINPFFRELSYPTEKLIHRREQKKYLALMGAIALLHQYQREAKRAVSEETGVEFEYVEVTLDDIALANDLTTAALSRALDELAPPVRGMYEEFRRLCEARAKELRCPADKVQLTRREIREATGWSDWQVRVYCQQLVELEYLSTTSGANGKRFVYELAFYRPDGDGPPKLRGLVDVSELRRKQFRRLKEKSERRATNLVAKK